MNTEVGDFEDWLKEWMNNTSEFYRTDINCVIDYDCWKLNPHHGYDVLCDVVDAPKRIKPKQVEDWINPELMH